MKKKIKKRIRNICIQQRKYEEKIARSRESLLYTPYKLLAEELESTFLKLSDFKDKVEKIIENTFKPSLQKVLLKVSKLNIDEFLSYFTETFKRTLNLQDIQDIKSKLLNRTLKKYTAKTVVDVTETTKSILNAKITAYTQQGMSFNEMVKKIVEDTKGEIGKNRAKVIARTETAKAIGETNFKTATKAKLKNKTWVHAGGGKKDRKSHIELDGVTIGINESFNVGAEGSTPPTQIRFPKDPQCTVAGHIIGCLCQIYYF